MLTHSGILLFFFAAVASAAAVAFGASAVIGTTDAFFAAFFRSVNEENSGSYNDHQNGDQNIIN